MSAHPLLGAEVAGAAGRGSSGGGAGELPPAPSPHLVGLHHLRQADWTAVQPEVSDTALEAEVKIKSRVGLNDWDLGKTLYVSIEKNQ